MWLIVVKCDPCQCILHIVIMRTSYASIHPIPSIHPFNYPSFFHSSGLLDQSQNKWSGKMMITRHPTLDKMWLHRTNGQETGEQGIREGESQRPASSNSEAVYQRVTGRRERRDPQRCATQHQSVLSYISHHASFWGGAYTIMQVNDKFAYKNSEWGAYILKHFCF